MVYNPTRRVKLPFGNADMSSHTKRIIAKGEGVGAVLLRTGGGGAASSYADMDDYIRTTGINPYARNTRVSKVQSAGKGINSSLADKLSKLSVVPDGKKKKNIVMSF